MREKSAFSKRLFNKNLTDENANSASIDVDWLFFSVFRFEMNTFEGMLLILRLAA
jgi:hypothetical protein